MEFVTIRHPDIDVPAEVTRAAFDAVFAEKGWVIVDEPAPAPAGDGPDTEPADPAEPAPSRRKGN